MPEGAQISRPAAIPPVYATPIEPEGNLIIIGGRENKEGHKPILEELARHVDGSKLVVATIGREEPEEQWNTYERVFRDLGIHRIEQLDARRREELVENPRAELLDDANVVFFAGAIR